MDDPIHPEDEPRLEAIIAEREKSRFNADPATADGRARRVKRPALRPQPPVNDILSPPPDDRGRQPVTRVASKCRLKDSTDIPDSHIPSDRPNNSAFEQADAGAQPGVVVEIASLITDMKRHGVSRLVADALVAQFSPSQIRLQLEALPLRDAKDPAAVLVKSIREGWAPPPGLLDRRKKQAAQKIRDQSAVKEKPKPDPEQAELAETQKQLDVYWQGLSAPEKARVEAEAREALRRTNPFVAQLMERAGEGKIVRATLESLRQQILLGKLGLRGPSGPP